MEKVTKRQERMMQEMGMRTDKVSQLADKYMEDLKNEGATLGEAKAVARRMAHILHRAERHRPETLLSNIALRDQ